MFLVYRIFGFQASDIKVQLIQGSDIIQWYTPPIQEDAMKISTACKAFALLAIIILAGCSSTTLTGSWSDPEYSKPVNKVYIVGVSKQETHRRIFEDEFGQELKTYGIQAVPSYKDLKNAKEADLDKILEKVKRNEADALLMTRIVDKRTEEVVNPGRVTGYRSSHPYYGYRDYYPNPYYHHYRDYYDRRYEMVYEPATITRYKVITLESNLYDAETGNLIWSAQLETVMEGTIQKMIRDYIEVVTKDLVEQGVI